MKNLILAITILIGTTVTAQNWSLVMPNDTLVYEKQDNHQFFTVWVDSVHVSGTDTTYFMNRISPGEVIRPANINDTCSSSSDVLMGEFPISILNISAAQFIGLSINMSGLKTTISYNSQQIIIYPNATLNSQWVCDSVALDSMKLVSIDTAFLQSYQTVDSIKVFEYKNQQFVLSKNHGVIAGLDFRSSVLTPYAQIGVQNLQKGTTIPMGMEYFDFSVGDIFVRWNVNWEPENTYINVYKSEITSKNVINDTLIYVVKNVLTNDITEWKYWPNMNPILHAYPNTLDSTKFMYVGLWLPHQLILTEALIFRNNSGQIERNNREYIFMNGIRNAFCASDSGLISYSSLGPSFKYIAGLGAVIESMLGVDSGEFDELKGYIKNGIPFGDTTSISEIDYSNFIKIFPNPTHNLINITTEKINGVSVLELYDLRGRIIAIKTFERDLTFDVSTYQQGVYFAIIKDNDGAVLYREKIIIQ